MKKLSIKLPAIQEREYPIFVGSQLIEKISELMDLSSYSTVFVITDQIVAPLYLDRLLKNLPEKSKHIILPAGEEAKDITHLTEIWKAMIDAKLDRKSLVINLGGGVIGDMGGFAASTYMRGISFLNIPTTLLAQIDANIGGKTAIDFGEIKNIIGTFYQPSGVIIDVTTVKTLPKRQVISGFAEIIKHGLIADKNYFKLATAKKPLDFSQSELTDIISGSCGIKSAVVEKDEKEKGLRKLLNFGHTIGHAIEALSLQTDKPLLHGEAVSIGMKIESDLSHRIGLLSHEDMKEVEQTLEKAALPTDLPDFPVDKIIEKMKSDKKTESRNINFTLLKRIGKGEINQIVEEKIIKEVLIQA